MNTKQAQQKKDETRGRLSEAEERLRNAADGGERSYMDLRVVFAEVDHLRLQNREMTTALENIANRDTFGLDGQSVQIARATLASLK